MGRDAPPPVGAGVVGFEEEDRSMERGADPMRLWVGTWGTGEPLRSTRTGEKKPDATVPADPQAPGPEAGLDLPESR
jgi:hypothetical protein